MVYPSGDVYGPWGMERRPHPKPDQCEKPRFTPHSVPSLEELLDEKKRFRGAGCRAHMRGAWSGPSMPRGIIMEELSTCPLSLLSIT